ncbi:hypothetical protein Ppb6_01883 [Photorhabdus australis subsp. thailandensis]|uniref:Uncharacterized protein n=1 Tax=Photorhabdus australis subsp. thailandensis TaxID=2805096 RepID=A0A1C0U4X8_9GAMM|nr:YwqJ-related putative deaminase [Photorhabdus australis]OCQ52990.1 hypothetical protein Ppb6_01883 [Photorhabdus australis subsp. thailandensis]
MIFKMLNLAVFYLLGNIFHYLICQKFICYFCSVLKSVTMFLTKVAVQIALYLNILPTMAGIAGLHAEVQALNNLFISGDRGTEKRENWKYIRNMLESTIFTQRLTAGQAGKDFAACHNCSGILSSPVNVITGKVESAGGNFFINIISI